MPEELFLAENGANLRKVSFWDFFVYYISVYHICIRLDIGSSTRTLRISLSTMIANGTKENLPALLECRHGPNNLSRERKLA